MSVSKHLAIGLPFVVQEKQAYAPPMETFPPPTPPLRKTPFTTFFGVIQHELDVTERLLRSNAIGFLFIFMGGLLARFIRAPPSSLRDAAKGTVLALAADLLCSYTFDICNQATSPEEDSLNKPYRPIPAGLLTVEQAKARWLISWALGPLVLYHLFGTWAMVSLLSHEALIAFCYVWPRWNNWFMRNLFVALIYYIQGRLLNQMLASVGPGWDMDMLIDLSISAWFMGTIHVQEFHDVEGDRKSGRKTLAVLLSPRGLRVLRTGTALSITAFGAGLAFLGFQKMDQHVFIGPVSVLQLVSSAVLAYRVWASNSPEMDRVTYQVYYYIPVLFILIALALVFK
ncbi:hypothetical protein PG999_003692 [Apiospora kogelbergensis]|uniref:4-hydroxybenzoate polyprenyltransferase n=1 Tax=Apiospora kogelbergensis TaxID=1337665 RepID=A0AAW0R4H7_9PEZI